ncbi:hypothetical protein N7471_013396, partial [Penicillium samsonianum]|uniref:uncharacterized protein n=1 Tax=Penicillium samsonianum TaxID=1882272 RepID=UPI00254901A2
MRVSIRLTIFMIADVMKTKILTLMKEGVLMNFYKRSIAAMLKLEGLLQENGEPAALLHQVQDASRFIRYHRLAIESCPLQVYSSPLIFSPMPSLTRRCYQRERPDWVLNELLVDKDWSPCLQPSRGIAIRSCRLPGRKMEADSHQRQEITPPGSGIRPRASARQLSR